MASGGSGRVELVHGCMFGGKSTELLRRLQEAHEQGEKVCLVKPRKDDRYARTQVVTHDGKAMDAIEIDEPGELIGLAGEADVVGVDECHFFDATFATVCRELRKAGKRVIVAGVDLNHRGVLFDVMRVLMAVADDSVHCTARCSVCGGEAIHSQRMVADDSPIVVGGADLYEPRCEACFERPE